MPIESEKQAWILDQITKSNFFHKKLHEWGLLEIAYELENIRGEALNWDLGILNISEIAWNKVIHKGIKPIKVFCHPNVISENPRRISYYRMLAMVSQKSMSRIGFNAPLLESDISPIAKSTAISISKHLNKIICTLIEQDMEVDQREFDIWRGMAAGSQAQGSWQNIKGNKIETNIKDLIKKRLYDKQLILKDKKEGNKHTFYLKNNSIFIFGSEPDIAVYSKNSIHIAIEIKGGIDTAGVLERFGAVLKSLRRAKQENPNSTTILIMQNISLTQTAKEEIDKSKTIIDYYFSIEELIENENIREKLFHILGI